MTVSIKNVASLILDRSLYYRIGLPILDGILSSSSVSLTLLKTLNVAAFATNCISVSMPGRLDGPQDEAMREGTLNPNKPNTNSPLLPYRTLVNPAGTYTMMVRICDQC